MIKAIIIATRNKNNVITDCLFLNWQQNIDGQSPPGTFRENKLPRFNHQSTKAYR